MERHRAVGEFPLIDKPFRLGDLARRLRSISTKLEILIPPLVRAALERKYRLVPHTPPDVTFCVARYVKSVS